MALDLSTVANRASTVAGRARSAVDFVETCAAQASHPEHGPAFRELQRGRPQRLARVVATSVYDVATLKPALTLASIGRSLPGGTTYAGAGGHYIAYRVGGAVIKVHKASARMSEAERERLAEREQGRGDLVRRFLGAVAAPQTVTIAAHPTRPGLRVVQISQPYFDYEDLHDIFPAYRHHIDQAALQRALARHPGLEEQLRTLSSSSLAMVAETGLAPDVMGRGNVGLDRSGGAAALLLIDLQPILIDGHPIGSHTLAQLEDLDRSLARVSS